MTKKLPEKLPLGNTENTYPRAYLDIEARQGLNEIIDYLTPEAPTDTEEKGDWIESMFNEFCENNWTLSETDKSEFRKYIDKHLPKPVEQELIPLDVKQLSYEIYTKIGLDKLPDPYTNKFIIERLLSKYGVHKQEEKEDWTDEEIQQWMNNIRGGTEEAIKYGIKTIKGFLTFHGIHKGSFKKRSEMYISTPQATSVIDIDKEKSQNRFEIMIHDIESIMYTQLNTLRDSQTHDNRISIAKGYIKKRQEQGLLPIQKKRSEDEVECYWNLDSTENEVKHTIQFLKAHNLLSD